MFAASGNCGKLLNKPSLTLILCILVFVSDIKSAAGSDSIQQLNTSVVSLVEQVSPAVVQVLVSGYGTVEEHGQTNTALIGRQRS